MQTLYSIRSLYSVQSADDGRSTTGPSSQWRPVPHALLQRYSSKRPANAATHNVTTESGCSFPISRPLCVRCFSLRGLACCVLCPARPLPPDCDTGSGKKHCGWPNGFRRYSMQGWQYASTINALRMVHFTSQSLEPPWFNNGFSLHLKTPSWTVAHPIPSHAHVCSGFRFRLPDRCFPLGYSEICEFLHGVVSDPV